MRSLLPTQALRLLRLSLRIPRQAWSNFSSINLVLFSHSYYSVLLCSRKNFIITATPVLTPLHFALPLFILLLTPPSPPTNHAPPTGPTHPTRLTRLIPLHGTTHPSHHEGHPCPSKSSLPATLASVAALSILPASSPFPSRLSPSDPI